MKKRLIVMTMVMFLFLVSIVACGNNVTTNEVTTGKITDENGDMNSAIIENSNENDKEIITENIETSSGEDNSLETYSYNEEKDIFVVEDIDIGDGAIIDLSNEELDENKYTITESIDIYSMFGTYAGYTKPNIYVGSVGRIDGWVSICFAKSSYLAKEEDFNKVAVAEKETNSDTSTTENVASEIPNETPTTEKVPVETPVEIHTEAPAQTSNKYTPDEAIAVYRSLMEAGGITWNPGLKDVTSWGTGWIYLEKGKPEWCAETNLKSFAYGDSTGNPWTEYYLEVTGSDENAVYITEWHN